MKPDERLHDEAQQRQSPSAHIVYETILIEGEEELKRKSSALAWSGLAAGLSMGFSFISEALLREHTPPASWQPLIAKLGYSVGFLIVILGRQQLFTENTLTVVLPLLLRKNATVLRNLLRLWTVVLLSNLLGGFLFAWVIGHSEVFHDGMRSALSAVASEATGHSFAVTLLRAVFAGWLIALMVWLLPFAESARISIIILLTYLIGVAHFPHIIAGSIEVFYLASGGGCSWGEAIGGFIVPTLLGNIIGGVALVAALGHAQTIGASIDE